MPETLVVNSAVFDQEVTRVLANVRSTFAQILEHLPSRVAGPAEISVALGIHKKLAWHVSKVVYHPDLSVAGQHIPGPRAIQTFLRAAARHQVPRNFIDSATVAVGQFERLSETHAGDRASLRSMIANSGGRTGGEAGLAHRKAAYMSGSAIWGAQAQAQFFSNIIHVGKTPGKFDLAAVRGLVDLRRVRANMPWVITRVSFVDDDGQDSRVQREPLDPPELEPPGVPPVTLMRRFCSQPLPQLRCVGCRPGVVEYELVEGPVGNTGAVTVVTGDVIRGAGPLRQDEHNRTGLYATHVRTPCRVVISDLIVHEDVFGPLKLNLSLYSELRGPDVWFERESLADRIPFWETIEHLGRGAGVVHTPAIPRYGELIQHVFDTLGWEGDRCDVYRVRMEFPPVPAAVVVRHPLPESHAVAIRHAMHGAAEDAGTDEGAGGGG